MAFISTAYLPDHNALEPPGELRLTNKQYTLLIIISGGWAESIHKKKLSTAQTQMIVNVSLNGTLLREKRGTAA